MLEQRVGKRVELVAVLLQQRDDLLVRFLDDSMGFVVDQLLCVLRNFGDAGQERAGTVGGDYRERPDNAGREDLVAMWKLRRKAPLPSPRAGRQARAQLRDGKGDLKWSGGRAGS